MCTKIKSFILEFFCCQCLETSFLNFRMSRHDHTFNTSQKSCVCKGFSWAQRGKQGGKKPTPDQTLKITKLINLVVDYLFRFNLFWKIVVRSLSSTYQKHYMWRTTFSWVLREANNQHMSKVQEWQRLKRDWLSVSIFLKVQEIY